MSAFPRMSGSPEDDRILSLEKRVRRIEVWVPIFLMVAAGVTALATLMLKVSMLIGSQ